MPKGFPRENGMFLRDIQIRETSPAFRIMLNSPELNGLLHKKAVELLRLYQARVGKKTGRLAASGKVGIRTGGKHKDRIIAAVTIADAGVVSEWKGKPFYYGVYHEQGTLNSKRAKRRNPRGGRGPRPGYYELRETAQLWRG